MPYPFNQKSSHWLVTERKINMKNRKPTKYAGIFSYESKGMKLYGLKFYHKGTQVQKQRYTSLDKLELKSQQQLKLESILRKNIH